MVFLLPSCQGGKSEMEKLIFWPQLLTGITSGDSLTTPATLSTRAQCTCTIAFFAASTTRTFVRSHSLSELRSQPAMGGLKRATHENTVSLKAASIV